MTSPDPLTDERLAEDLPIKCHICGWGFQTVDGLWSHIPTHTLTPAQYGTLVKYEELNAEISRLQIRLVDQEHALIAARAERDVQQARGGSLAKAVDDVLAEALEEPRDPLSVERYRILEEAVIAYWVGVPEKE